MSTEQLKNLVVDQIYDIDDEDLLLAVKKILEVTVHSHEPLHLTEEQKDLIKDAQNEIARGDFICDEDLLKDEDQWLKE